MDEIGFRIGIGGDAWIMTLDPTRTPYIPSKTERDSITCVEAVNAEGDQIPPMVILPGNRMYESWVTNDLEDGVLLAINENAYMNDVLALSWLKHFDGMTAKRQKGTYRMLLLDNHTTHTTKQFVDYCDRRCIIPFALPPHSTHLLQPLDLVVFGPYKHWHRQAVDAATRKGCVKFDKVEFLAALQSMRNQTFKKHTVKSAWRVAGVRPFNPETVIAKLPRELAHSDEPSAYGLRMDLIRGRVERTLTPEPSTPTAGPLITPQTVRSLKRMRDSIRDDAPNSPSLMRKFKKGSIIQAHVGALAVAEVAEQSADAQARRKRSAANRRIVASGGVMRIDVAREIAKEKLGCGK